MSTSGYMKIVERQSERDQLLAVLRQFRQELKAVGRVRDAHLIEWAIDRVRRKQLGDHARIAPT
jgi:hypothetical protein